MQGVARAGGKVKMKSNSPNRHRISRSPELVHIIKETSLADTDFLYIMEDLPKMDSVLTNLGFQIGIQEYQIVLSASRRGYTVEICMHAEGSSFLPETSLR